MNHSKRPGPHAGGPEGRPAFKPEFRGPKRPPLRLMTTTLWEYPSQHYDSPDGSRMQGSKNYVGATPSWVIWQLLQRYTRENDVVIDPMVGSGTTIDVCRDLNRRVQGFDLNPQRPDIAFNDARELPLPDASADFVFIDPPYSTHVEYSDDPRCIGKLDAGAEDQEYFHAMADVIAEIHRVLKNRRYMALYVSDSFRKGQGTTIDRFMPIGFALFEMLAQYFRPADIICVVRHNQKLQRGNWHKAAEEGNFFLRGFNYLFIMKKEDDEDSDRGAPPSRQGQPRSDQPRSDQPRSDHPRTGQPRSDQRRADGSRTDQGGSPDRPFNSGGPGKPPHGNRPNDGFGPGAKHGPNHGPKHGPRPSQGRPTPPPKKRGPLPPPRPR